jgi:hypothetical protein
MQTNTPIHCNSCLLGVVKYPSAPAEANTCGLLTLSSDLLEAIIDNLNHISDGMSSKPSWNLTHEISWRRTIWSHLNRVSEMAVREHNSVALITEVVSQGLHTTKMHAENVVNEYNCQI